MIERHASWHYPYVAGTRGVRGLALVAIVIGMAGCFPFQGPRTEGLTRCEQDRFDCQDDTELPEATSCDEDAELTVELGQGLDGFVAFEADQALERLSAGGGFQGGGASHAAIAVRVDGAALDEHALVGVELGVFGGETCTELADGEVMCDGVPWVGERSVVLGQDPGLNMVDGMVEEFGITIPLNHSGPRTYVLRAIAQDACGNLDVAHHVWTE